MKPDPRPPKIVKVIEPEELAERTGYTRPHTMHCGPEGIYVSALGNARERRPAALLMDPQTFEPLGHWEIERGPQQLAYDGWWHLGYDTLVTSEWGTPDTIEDGLVPEILLGAKYGRRLHFWDLTGAGTCRQSTSATSTSSCSSCAPPTIRPRPMAS